MTSGALEIRRATFPGDVETVRRLFEAYLEWIHLELGDSLSYQNTDGELAELPGKYAEPRGAVWLGYSGEAAAGCVAVRPLPEQSVFGQDQRGMCELKRLWVAPEGRGGGLGGMLLDAALRWASDAGYRTMKLDSDSRLVAATGLYERAGFVATDRYNDDPMPCTVFMERPLGP